MVFSSAAFLFLFLPFSMALYFFRLFPKNSKWETVKKNFILLFLSLLFYAWGEPFYIILILISVAFNYFAGLDLEYSREKPASMKAILVFAIALNVLSLSFFKYSDFFIENINKYFSLNISFTAPAMPLGISFYTFQIISYLVDVYKGTPAQKNPFNFACYITMFPQLISGPIVQYHDIAPQLKQRNITLEKIAAGIIFFIRGLGKKVIFANTIAVFYNEVVSSEISSISAATAWLGIICYSLQLYFDFSGYSDMAVGLGKMMGFDLVQNFNHPYAAVSVTDFWRRWHISLGNWFRDYIYIPLGGNRVGTARHIFNIFVVWSLTGLWHGAAWNFVAWGLMYGIVLLIEKYLLKNVLTHIPKVLRWLGTLGVVTVGWVLFSSQSFSDALAYLSAMVGGNGIFFDGQAAYLIKNSAFSIIVMSLSAFGFFTRMPRVKNYRFNVTITSISYIIVFVISIIYMISETYNTFLYFRF